MIFHDETVSFAQHAGPISTPRIGAHPKSCSREREIWWWDLAVKKVELRCCEKSPVLLLIFFWWRKPTQGAATDKSTLFKRRTAPTSSSRYLRFTGSFFPFSQSQPREREARCSFIDIYGGVSNNWVTLSAQSYLKNTLLNECTPCLDVWIIYNPPANNFKIVALGIYCISARAIKWHCAR